MAVQVYISHIRPCINEKIAIQFLSELMKNIIVMEGGFIKVLMFSEEFMALVMFINWDEWTIWPVPPL